jgi:hypothetical protein
MSLPGGERRALNRIERALLEEDRRLGALFAVFTRLTGHEAMPLAERVTAGPWRLRLRVRTAALTALGLAAVTSILLVGVLVPGRPTCPGGAATVMSRTQSFRAVRQVPCPARKPAGTSHAAIGQADR